MKFSELMAQLKFLTPELVLCGCGIVVLFVELTKWRAKNLVNAAVCIWSFAAALVILWVQAHHQMHQVLFYDTYLLDPFVLSGKFLILVAGILTVLASTRYVEIHEVSLAEYLSFLTFSILGMFVFLSADDFLILFLGLELLSFPTYILTGIKVKNERSCEGAFKYLVMGAFSSAILLFGIGLIYGATQSTKLAAFTQAFAAPPQGSIFLLGVALLLTGFGFKLSLVPFHAWTPDAYEGAPTTITAFMSVTMKVAGFFVFIRVFSTLNTPVLADTIAVIALLSIIVGNFYGLVQENVKRLLAYSAIAHGGYIMLGFLDTAHRDEATYGMMFYLVNYLFMNMAALLVLVYLTTKDKYTETLSDLRGIGQKRPLLGLVMIVAMFSLAGLPPTPGFLAKFYVLKSAVQAGYIVTVVLALVSTILSLYYYAKILIVMYMEEEAAAAVVEKRPYAVAIAMAVAIAALFYLAIFPEQIFSMLLAAN